MDSVAVIGAGTLGWQLALTFALRSVPVRLHDVSVNALQRGLKLIEHELSSFAHGGEIDAGASLVLERITPCDTLADAIKGAWLVIEAIPERLETKRGFFADVSAQTGPEVVLASNSSSFKSREWADVTIYPERMLNTHFYGRPWLRPAVELMTCGSTDPAVIERVRAFFTSVELRPFVCRGESTGFLFNRIWHAIKQESLRVVAEGHASPAEIDELWRIVIGSEAFGPFERMDRVGLDVVLDIERHYAAESGLERDEPPAMLIDMVERGELGIKSGRGFYDYSVS